MARQLLVSLLLAACSVVTECKYPWQQTKKLNIRQFVSTQENIWTYKTSDRRHIKCKVDVKQFETGSAVFFNEWYKAGTEKVYGGYKGHFDQKHQACMSVSNKGTRNQQCMVYYSKSSGCAVIQVKTESGETYHDLRVPEPYIRFGVSEKCFGKFTKYETGGQVIYDASCNDIFAERRGSPRQRRKS